MEDQEIIKLYWDRDEQALRSTAEKYGTYCVSIALNILENKEDADECVNDAYWHTWETIPPHKPQILSTFLGKITRNLAINRRKRNTACKRGGGQFPVIWDELAECVSDTNSPDQEIDRQELLRALNSFLRELPPEKRNIFLCRYWYFDSVTEIANRFQMKENNVSVILSRLRLKLRCYLKKGGFDV